MVYFLIFMATINLVGFTLLPYVVGKDESSSCFLPLHVFHKYFVLIQLGILNLVVVHFNANALIPMMVLSLVAISDLFFGWKWYLKDLFFGDGVEPVVYTAPCVDLRHDIKCFANYSYKMKPGYNNMLLTMQDSRLMADLINFSLSVVLINLFL